MKPSQLFLKINFLPRHAKIGFIGFIFVSLCSLVVFRVDKMNFKPLPSELRENLVYDRSLLQHGDKNEEIMNQADQVIETVQKISVKLSSTGDYDKQIEETNEMEAGIYPNETTTHTYNEIFTETVEQNTVYVEQVGSNIQDTSKETKLAEIQSIPATNLSRYKSLQKEPSLRVSQEHVGSLIQYESKESNPAEIHSSPATNQSQYTYLEEEPPLRHYIGAFVKQIRGKVSFEVPVVPLRINRTGITDARNLHPLSSPEPYRSRILDIQRKCAKYESSVYSHQIDAKRFVYDDEHKFVMCIVPKDACTTWKQIIWYMTGHSSLNEAFSHAYKKAVVLDYGKMKSMAKLSSAEILKKLNTYTKFMVTRHPFRRLVSAYHDKFQSPSEFAPYRMRYGRLVAMQAIREYIPDMVALYLRRGGSKALSIKRLQTHPGFEKLTEVDQGRVLDIASRGYTGSITFEEFVRFAVLRKSSYGILDIHWRPQYMLCNPCAIDYDYVIRFDNIADDSNRLLSYLQRNDPPDKKISFPDNKPPTVNVDIAKLQFEAISSTYTSRLKQLYEPDFELFNHDFDMTG